MPSVPRSGDAGRERAGQRRSKRSSSMTLAQAATKSCDELLAGVVAGVDLGERAQLGVGAEDQVGPACRSSARSPAARRGLEGSASSDRSGVQVVPRSSRLTKKSFVSAPGRSVRTPSRRRRRVGAEHPQAADQHGHLGRAQGRAGWPGRRGGTPPAAGCPCRGSCGSRRPSARAQANDSTSVCSCVASRATRGERHLDGDAAAAAPPSRRRRCRPARSGRRARPACRRLRVVERSAMPSSVRRARAASCVGSLTSQPLCGSSRIRAPLAPPRLSLPRNVDADGPGGRRPAARRSARRRAICCLERRDVGVVDEVVRRPPGRGSCQSSSSAGTSGPR